MDLVIKKIILKLVKNNLLLREKIKQNGLSKIVLETFPVRFVTYHTKNYEKPLKEKAITINNLSRYFFGVIKCSVFNIIRLKRLKIHNQSNYEFLVFLPNAKYEEYFEEISKKFNNNYLVISENELVHNYYSSLLIDNDYFENYKLIFLEIIFFLYYPVYLLMKRDYREVRHILAMRGIYHQFFQKNIYFSFIFSKNKFKKYLSFLPNGDNHRIIQLYFSDNFEKSFGIRPEQIILEEEERYNIADVLFYKSEYEKWIYEQYQLHKVLTLLKAGVLVRNNDDFIRKNNNYTILNVLILDTCTNYIYNSEKIRETGLDDIYTCLFRYQEGIVLYHKFHPGLEKILRFDTENKLKLKEIKVVESVKEISDIQLIISYNSSILQRYILSKIPILLLSGRYDSFDNLQVRQALDYSPVKRIEKIEDLDIIMKSIISGRDISELCSTEELYDWFVDYYNYPMGLNEMIRIINE